MVRTHHGRVRGKDGKTLWMLDSPLRGDEGRRRLDARRRRSDRDEAGETRTVEARADGVFRRWPRRWSRFSWRERARKKRARRNCRWRRRHPRRRACRFGPRRRLGARGLRQLGVELHDRRLATAAEIADTERNHCGGSKAHERCALRRDGNERAKRIAGLVRPLERPRWRVAFHLLVERMSAAGFVAIRVSKIIAIRATTSFARNRAG